MLEAGSKIRAILQLLQQQVDIDFSPYFWLHLINCYRGRDRLILWNHELLLQALHREVSSYKWCRVWSLLYKSGLGHCRTDWYFRVFTPSQSVAHLSWILSLLHQLRVHVCGKVGAFKDYWRSERSECSHSQVIKIVRTCNLQSNPEAVAQW